MLIVARHIKVLLDQLGLSAFPKTSGATGMQIYVPITLEFTYEETRELVGRLGHLLRRADPDRVTMEWEVRKRTGKVFVDHNMNRIGANIAAVWSIRPEPAATVSMPVSWDEVEAGAVRPGDFTITSIWDRLEAWGGVDADPFRGVLTDHQDIAPALDALDLPRAGAETGDGDDGADGIGAEMAAGGARAGDASAPGAPAAGGLTSDKGAAAIARSEDPKLAQYLTMRTFGGEGTPEPAGGEPSPGGNSFVIQKHDATRLHYDLRLERDGVLVSWAVPKGLPFVKGVRHLAVHTEDHPLEYGSFEGSIPKDHYGAGEVRIWDHGTYDLLEWTDTKVSFRLHGERHHGEYHLVKTRGEKDWLIFMATASEEDAPPAPPAFQPMLAEPGHQPFDAPGWRFEP